MLQITTYAELLLKAIIHIAEMVAIKAALYVIETLNNQK